MGKPRMLAEIPSFIQADGMPDLGAVAAAADRLLNAGYEELVVMGPAGEYDNLTFHMQEQIIACAVEACRGRARLFAGAFELGTARAARRIEKHAAAGCHHHLCIPAHYFGLSHQDELTRHFQALAETDGGVMILDSAAYAGFSITPPCLAQLCGMPGIEGAVSMTLDAGEFTRAQVPLLVQEELRLLGVQAAGYLTRLACLFPRLCQAQHLPMHVRSAMLHLLTLSAHPAAVIKHAALCMGLAACGDVLAPGAGLSSEQKRTVKSLCAQLAREEALADG